MSVVERSRTVRMAVRAVLGLASLSACTAMAQQGAPANTGPRLQEIEEIVIIGFRQSLNQALDLKREQIGSIDAIVAEDIADFPDLNLAESLQRIPGVSIARDAGEGRSITVRGLSPEFTRVRLNGMEAMSANGGTDAAGGTNRGRSFDFNTFASELFSGITVRKTASADIEEGSLGATVDLRTARPFDYDGFTLVTSATAQYNDLAEEVNPRAAFVISNTFANRTLGALLSVAYTERELVDEGASTVRWGNPSGPMQLSPNYIGQPSQTDINRSFVPRIPRYDYYAHEQDRLGVTASLQFAPNDRTSVNLDMLYAEFNATRREIFLSVPNFSGGAQGIQVVDAIIDNSNSLVYGVFNNVDIRSEQRFDDLSTEFTQVTLDVSHKINDRLSINGLVGMSEADHSNPVQTTLLFDWNNIPQMTYDFRQNSRLPLLNFGNTDLTSTVMGQPFTTAGSTQDSGGWYLSQIRMRPQTTNNEFRNYQVDVRWDASDMLQFSGGVQMKEFDFITSERRIDPSFCTPPLAPNANAESCAAVPARTVALQNYSRVLNFGSDLGLPAGSSTSFLIPDYAAAVGALNLGNIPLSTAPSLGNNRAVEERDTGVFLQAQLISDIRGMPLRGNLGVRYVQTDQTAQGFFFVGTAPLLATSKRKYSDTLPSLNLSLGVTNDIVVRASAAKVMSRPTLDALTPGAIVSVSGNNRSVNIGNPNIDPTRAKAYDLGVEWYFAPESLLAVSLFYKDIDSRAVSFTLSDQVFTGNPFGIPDAAAITACGGQPNCAPNLANWNFNTTVNGPGGDLKGVEISYQQPFTFLPGIGRNFGAVLNYTGVDSEIQYTQGITEDLVGLSRNAYNATLYYETERFGARVSAAYRDQFLTMVPGRNGNDVEGTADVTTIDASARFTVNANLDLTLEGINLTDEFQDQYVDSRGNRLSYYHHTGRSFLLGARYKF